MTAATPAIASVYALIGKNRFLRGESLAQLLQTIAGRSPGMSQSRFDGPKAELAEVLDEVRTPSLLGDRRVAVVDDADDLIQRHREALERYCTAPAHSGTLILLCDSLPGNTRLHRALKARGGVVECTAPSGPKVPGWLTDRAAKAHGKRLTSDACERLREHLGDDLGMLDAELSKLAAYVGGRDEITAADVAELTGTLREETVFAVVDAMVDGDVDAALRCWEQVVATDPVAPDRAIGGLAYGVRRLSEARRDWQAGRSLNEVLRPFYVDREAARKRLQRVGEAQLEAMQRGLLAADLDLKTGLTTIDRAVEKFIVTNCAVPATQGRSAPRRD